MLPDRTIFPSCSTSVTSSARHESYCRNSTKGGNDKVLQGGPAADRGRVRGIVRQAAAPGRHPAAGAHRAPPRRARGIPTLGARPAERCVQLARRIASVVVLLDRALAQAHCPGQRAGGARRPGRWLPLALPRRRRRLLRRPGAGAAPRADVRGGVRPRHARHRARIRVPRPRQTALVPTADEDCRRRFRMHEDGECDVRGSYTALAVASLANVLDAELAAGAAEWIASCQTHEGGIGATPGEEAHGGYTFCGLAGLVLLGAVDRLRVPQLAHWLAQRQMGAEGGFQGRTNKLVDGCYSFWQGGSFPLLHAAIQQRHRSGGEGRGDSAAAAGAPPFFNARALLDYVMVCCQVPHGGSATSPAARATTTTPATASPASRSASPLSLPAAAAAARCPTNGCRPLRPSIRCTTFLQRRPRRCCPTSPPSLSPASKLCRLSTGRNSY